MQASGDRKKQVKYAKRRERLNTGAVHQASVKARNERKKQRKQEAPGIQKTMTGRGADINAPASDVESLQQQLSVQNAIRVLPVTATVNRKTISNLALGIILSATKNGLVSAFTSDETNPYYMFRYLITIFTQAMQGTVPAVQQAPVWMWELLTALRPRQCPFKLGSVKYEWDFVESSVTSDSPIAMGISTAEYYVAFGPYLPGVNIIGFPAIGVNSTYDDAIGEKALDNLWAYIKGSDAMCKLTATPESLNLHNDTSTFSAVFPELGGSFETPCAQRSTVYSERNVDSPMLAKFAEYQPTSQGPVGVWRGWQKATVNGGSVGMIGPTLAGMQHRDEVRSKVPPIIKFFNFDEFFEVLSLTLGRAMAPDVSLNGQPVAPCPLSPLEAQILLRQTMLPLFSNELHQDLRVTQSSSVPILPFVVGQNGASLGTSMLLPTNLAENIRASKTFFNRIRKDDPRSLIRVYSILGRPYDQPQLGNYFVDDTNNSAFVYAADSPVSISLIDASLTQNNVQYFLDFSTDQIKVLTQRWNSWIKVISNRLSPLVQIGTAGGISCLHTATLTNIQGQLTVLASVPQTPPTLTKQNSKVFKVPGLSRLGATTGGPAGNNYLSNIIDKQTTSLQYLTAPQWRFLSIWVLPVTTALGAATDEQSVQCWATFFMEVNRIPRSNASGATGGIAGSATNPPTAFDRHAAMASVDTKTVGADVPDNMIEELVQLGEKGRGGFISAIAGLLGPAIQALAGG